MVDLSHWDFATHFKAKEAAELIAGIAPETNTNLFGPMGDELLFTQKITPILRRMGEAYRYACDTFETAIGWDSDLSVGFEAFPPVPLELSSLSMEQARANSKYLTPKISKDFVEDFGVALFSRSELSRWLEATGLRSKYLFSKESNVAIEVNVEVDNSKFDPCDLPQELDAANVAFRAVTKGYGDQAATPRNRLVDYLEKHYRDFKPEQVQRIATVANPDKTTGRKRSGKE